MEDITLSGFLQDMNEQKIPRGDVAMSRIQALIHSHEEYRETILDILNKDLDCGISVKTINKVFPKLIPEFNVPLAKKYEGQDIFNGADWYASRKLDGVRCLCFIYEDEILFYSRKGKEFYTLDKLKESLKSVQKQHTGFILDGEICAKRTELTDDFQYVASSIRRKDYEMDNFKFFVFDTYTIESFEQGSSVIQFSTKDLVMEDFISEFFEWLYQHRLTGDPELEEFLQSVPSHWEGVMLRKNRPTQFKRSNNLLKAKKFYDEEFIVKDIELGKKRIGGEECTCCGALVISHKGYTVKVGSGLSDVQRLSWYDIPSKIIGKTITVKYFSESMDKDGNLSLRFPTLKHVWEGEKI